MNYFKYLDSAALLSLSGTFWNAGYQGNRLETLLTARGICELQNVEDIDHLQGCNKPITTKARRLLLLPIDFIAGKANLPNDVIDVPYMSDGICQASNIYIKGLDYLFADNTIEFIRPGKDDKLWAHDVLIDTQALYDCWGAVFDIAVNRDAIWPDVLQLLYNILCDGAKVAVVNRLVGLIYASPCSASKEIVVAIGQDKKSNYVITDKEVYRSSYSPAVTKDLSIAAGTSLFDGLSIEHNNIASIYITKTDPLPGMDIRSVLCNLLPAHINISFEKK